MPLPLISPDRSSSLCVPGAVPSTVHNSPAVLLAVSCLSYSTVTSDDHFLEAGTRSCSHLHLPGQPVTWHSGSAWHLTNVCWIWLHWTRRSAHQVIPNVLIIPACSTHCSAKWGRVEVASGPLSLTELRISNKVGKVFFKRLSLTLVTIGIVGIDLFWFFWIFMSLFEPNWLTIAGKQNLKGFEKMLLIWFLFYTWALEVTWSVVFIRRTL